MLLTEIIRPNTSKESIKSVKLFIQKEYYNLILNLISCSIGQMLNDDVIDYLW